MIPLYLAQNIIFNDNNFLLQYHEKISTIQNIMMIINKSLNVFQKKMSLRLLHPPPPPPPPHTLMACGLVIVPQHLKPLVLNS